jgi:hypothetical protein
MKQLVEALCEKSPKLAELHANRTVAYDEAKALEVQLLTHVVEQAIRPILPVLSDRIAIKCLGRATRYADMKGICVSAQTPYPNQPESPSVAAGRTGPYVGSDFFLTEQGWMRLDYQGRWHLDEDGDIDHDNNAWEGTLLPINTADVVTKLSLEKILTNLHTRMEEHLQGSLVGQADKLREQSVRVWEALQVFFK